jgi:hypothetical protein
MLLGDATGMNPSIATTTIVNYLSTRTATAVSGSAHEWRAAMELREQPTAQKATATTEYGSNSGGGGSNRIGSHFSSGRATAR